MLLGTLMMLTLAAGGGPTSASADSGSAAAAPVVAAPVAARPGTPAAQPAASDPSAPLVRVLVLGAVGDRGTVRCALFHGEDGLPDRPKRAVARVAVKPVRGQAVCEFARPTAGEYAVGVIQDENDDGQLDTGLFGIPKEPYGASRDAKGSMGPPDYDDAKFTYAGGRLELRVHLRT